MFRTILSAVLLVVAGSAHASLIKITGTSASAGELGWFAVDDALLASDQSLVASQFFDYSFADPHSSVAINESNVGGDTGVTYFGKVSNIWTVIGGGGDSLTSLAQHSAVWIAGTNYLQFSGRSSYWDVSWSTKAYTPSKVPEPESLALFGVALGALAFMTRRKVIR